MRALLITLVGFALLGAGSANADDARAHWRAEDRNAYVGVPFELDLLVEGFAESPQPDPPNVTIPNATVKLVGAQPNVSRSIQIVNGQRSDSSHVTWGLRYRVVAEKEGTLHVPSVTISQGGKRATASPGDLEVDSVPTTDAMKIELGLPQRAVFVGENIPITLTWLFRASPTQDPSFSVPMLDGDAFTFGTPPQTDANTHTLKFPAGDKVLELPYTVDQVDVGGTKFNRFVATFYAAPKQPGKIDVAAASVVAALPTGRADFFGNAPSRLFRASDVARSLEVKPLPQTDRPAGFAGAVGTQFSIKVSTSRSVVSLGEPVELAIEVKSDARLDTLALGKLDGEGGLPKDKFSVPADVPTGELSPDGKTKTFHVIAQVTGPANEIPAIALSYFDPVNGAYQTVHSEPIAVSVKGSSIVGANDVVAATPTVKPRTPAGGSGGDDLTTVGADLALSAPGATDATSGGALMWLAIGLLYAIPLALFAVRTWQLRTRGRREEAAEVRAARRRVESELEQAARAPAREAAGPLATAVRSYARVLATSGNRSEPPDDEGVLARIETESFAPASASSPLSKELLARVELLVRGWNARPARTRVPKASAIAGALVIALAPHVARADATPAGDPLADGRAAYQQALSLADAAAKRAAFGRAETALGQAARAMPDRPELLADWGNAALGAGDVATATLAYRRALALDGDNTRARSNLAWIRGRQSDAVRPLAGGATDTLLFFHRWPRARRALVGAVAFAIAVLLVVPWTGRRRGLTALALVPLAVWLAMLGSLALEDRGGNDAVVMDVVALRAADSVGAPAATSESLPRGAEVTVLESRQSWSRVRLASGPTGWVPSGAIERVASH
jgi:hypothetical protein